MLFHFLHFLFFFFNDTATTEIYTLSLHDALPILHENTKANMAKMDEFKGAKAKFLPKRTYKDKLMIGRNLALADRKSTRLNSSHVRISYAVFCLKKKNSNGACS